MTQGNFYNNAVFWVEVDRISPNPYQPRREFDPQALEDLADSIRQYGVLQPLVVTRKEVERTDGSLYVEYELLAGERRLRAAKLAGLTQVPVLIRAKEDTNKVKLEIAIIENLQREDLNPIDRAKAFKQLADEFNLQHTDIAKKIGKSREYVSNSIRLLALPEFIQQALINRELSEGHARALLMLSEKPQEQETLFKEIVVKKMTVREAEKAARSIATERARRKDLPPELSELEKALTEELGTRVQIEKKEKGGKVRIDFFSEEDLYHLLEVVKTGHQKTALKMTSTQELLNSIDAKKLANGSQATPVLQSDKANLTEAELQNNNPNNSEQGETMAEEKILQTDELAKEADQRKEEEALLEAFGEVEKETVDSNQSMTVSIDETEDMQERGAWQGSQMNTSEGFSEHDEVIDEFEAQFRNRFADFSDDSDLVENIESNTDTTLADDSDVLAGDSILEQNNLATADESEESFQDEQQRQENQNDDDIYSLKNFTV